MKSNQLKGWLYLLPAMLFLGAFMVYPLVDVFVYSFEEGYQFRIADVFRALERSTIRYVLRDPYFLQALKNTFLMVVITVPLSTAFAIVDFGGLKQH